STTPDREGTVTLTEETIREVSAYKVLIYDENEHYDTISAFIKSMREGDEKQAVHYLARMISAGEDPLFIARRMVVFASEDIGLSDSSALTLALAVHHAIEVLGMPEARINLSHGVIALCRATKDRHAYEAIESALREVKESLNPTIPDHLRNWKVKNT
ncbi:MAG: replication-associated recombination protein A, partial [Candidatus Margulisiibacteriota bacterium]